MPVNEVDGVDCKDTLVIALCQSPTFVAEALRPYVAVISL